MLLIRPCHMLMLLVRSAAVTFHLFSVILKCYRVLYFIIYIPTDYGFTSTNKTARDLNIV